MGWGLNMREKETEALSVGTPRIRSKSITGLMRLMVEVEKREQRERGARC
jgi:hypothetical protein